MLLAGINHVALLTNDSDRLHGFYRDVFDAEIAYDGEEPAGGDGPGPAGGRGPRFSVIRVGPFSELNVFQFEGNHEADRQTPMFGRGRLDHMAVHAVSIDAFETIRDRLIARGSCDSFVTDFGPVLSLFFRDPDGLEGEVCVTNPDAEPGVFKGPGTPAARYQ